MIDEYIKLRIYYGDSKEESSLTTGIPGAHTECMVGKIQPAKNMLVIHHAIIARVEEALSGKP